MKALFVGGTGTISTAVSKKALEEGWDLYLLNRGSRNNIFSGRVKEIICDITDEEDAKKKLAGLSFDVVVEFTARSLQQVQRDYRIFKDKTGQYIFISSASAYQTPPAHYLITESTPLYNPFWEYSRNKIAGEEFLLRVYREEGFPVTIVRPSHTYDERKVPFGISGTKGSWPVLKRMMDGKQVIIHGDGTALWVMTHNSDFAKGFVGLMGNSHAIGEAVHITSDEVLTWNQIYRIIADILGVPLKPVYVSTDFLDKVSNYDFYGSMLGDRSVSVVFDNSKIKRLVPGFCATKRFDQGIRETIEYIKVHKEWQFEEPEFDLWCDRVIAVRGKAIMELKNGQ
jgi:nucleoside-diphosphate-sugar epimerase